MRFEFFKLRLAGLASLTTVCHFAQISDSPGQSALRQNLEGEALMDQRERMLETYPYNLRWGDWRLRASAGLAVLFDDNVYLSEDNPAADVVLQPSARLTSVLPVTERNSLIFDLNIGYLGYLKYPELSRFTIEPGSLASFDAYLGEVNLNVHDQLSYLDDPLATGPVSDSSRFGGLYNTLGISARRKFNQLQIEGGYDFSLFASSLASYDYLDRTTHSVFARTTAQVVPELELGVEASAAWVGYQRAVLNDNGNVSVGPFGNWQISEHLSWELRGGYLRYRFEPTGMYPPQADVGSYYFQTNLKHRVNQRLSQSLSVERSFQQGVSSELLDLWLVRHTLDWLFLRNTPLHTDLFYENGPESGGFQPDQYIRYGLSAVFIRTIGRGGTLRLGYQVLKKDSQLQGRDYLDQRVTLGAGLEF